MISVFFRKRIVDSISFRAAMRMIPLLIPHILHLNQPLSAAIIYRSFSSLNFLYFLNSSHTRSSIFHHCLSTYAGYLQVPLSTDMDQSSACSSISSSHTSYQTAKKLISLPLQKMHVAISILRCVFQHGYLWIKNLVSNNIWHVQQLVAIP